MKFDNFTFAKMRFTSLLLLVFFIFFSSLPTLMVLFDKEVEMSYSCSNSEEEESSSSFSEIKIFFKLKKIDYKFLLGYHSNLLPFTYIENNLLKLPSEVIVPPPKCITFYA